MPWTLKSYKAGCLLAGDAAEVLSRPGGCARAVGGRRAGRAPHSGRHDRHHPAAGASAGPLCTSAVEAPYCSCSLTSRLLMEACHVGFAMMCTV